MLRRERTQSKGFFGFLMTRLKTGDGFTNGSVLRRSSAATTPDWRIGDQKPWNMPMLT